MAHTANTANVVQRAIRIEAAPATVFEFLTTPAKMVPGPAANTASTSPATSASAAR